MEDMPPSPLNKEKIKADDRFDLNSRCPIPVDNETSFIGHQFREKGYITLMAEDWLGAINALNCPGFNSTPVDHYLRPFQLRTGGRAINTARMQQKPYYEDYNRKICREGHHIVLDYFKLFLEAYDNVDKKFSITWAADVAHDNLNGLYHADEYLYDTFSHLKSKLESSFFIVMGDHGHRYGAHRNTDIGEFEDNNPALFIALPKALRRNYKLRAIMEENAQHLLSHHNVYATLVSIAMNSAEWTDISWNEEWPKLNQLTKLPPMHGQSLLHKFPRGMSRDCANLYIPFAYCQCFGHYVTVADPVLINHLALASVKKLNHDIEMLGFSRKCEKLVLDKSANIGLSEIMNGKESIDSHTFKIKFQTVPGGGQFSIHLRVTKNSFNLTEKDNPEFLSDYGKVEFVANHFQRHNKHGHQSQCARDNPMVMYMCYCKM